MARNGYTPQYADQCFNMLKGFGEYGFPESHSASFALLVYVSAWTSGRWT
jgi:DNA polymerase III alpha subunit